MKAIMNGKRYNTETAAELGVASANGMSVSDFKYWREGLYRTPKGAYFLSGEGGGLSQFAESSGNGWGWGTRVTVVTREQAIAWLERHELLTELEEHFADAIEDA